jgi:hypothetical protein
MSLKTDARYSFGLEFARFMALNDDLTIPSPDRVIGGVGPFDFSGYATPAAIPLTIKFDAEAESTVNVNLTVGVVALTAVTVDELVARVNAAAPVDVTASKEIVPLTNRFKLEYSGTEVIGYMQVYGDLAELALIGQGLVCEFVKSDTLKSIGDTPKDKAEETIATTDAHGIDTEVITDGYRKGFTAKVVDTAEDWRLLALMEGGVYDAVAKTYEAPDSTTRKIYFYAEIFYAQYAVGSNKEADIIGYIRKFFRSCKGSFGEQSHQRGFADGNYSVVGTSYKDESNNLYSDYQRKELTVEDYLALDVYNV